MTTECAVCYVADINFLLPTLVSAAGLRKFVPAHKADVFIFLVDQEARIAELNAFLKPYDITVVAMESRAYSGFDTEKFNRSHVPLAALGRFFIESALPAGARRIVYIDGDTWIRRDPSALIEAVVPEGKLAAVEDMLSFRSGELTSYAKSMREYLAGLGVDPKQGYFNSGVFAVSRTTWRTMGLEAYKFIAENTVACQLHDQSSMNGIIGDRRLCLSLKWNFQTSYKYSGIERYVNPNIYHFTRSPKPWSGVCRPWEDMFDPYQAAIKPFAPLNLSLKTASAATLAEHNKLNWRKNLLLKSPIAAKLVSWHLGIGRYERSAWL